jgi:hypothetical protein
MEPLPSAAVCTQSSDAIPVSDPKIRYDPSIAELFVAGRHYKLFSVSKVVAVKAAAVLVWSGPFGCRASARYGGSRRCSPPMSRDALLE